MSSDTELLRRYVEERSEAAFAELVQEHLNLVYSAALREMNDDLASAEDVSQAVFTELARKAPRLLGHPSLAGWLYTTVRHLAANLRRAEYNRRRREEEAQTMTQIASEDSPDQAWQQIRPALDDALHQLKAADREAVVLRFLEDRPLREVGARLGLNENAARMRVDRALDKLRALLERRGVTSTAFSLSAAFAVGVVTPAPPALAATIVSASLASGTAAGSTTLTLLKLMSISKAQTAMIGALVVAGVAVPAWQQTRLQRARAETEQWRAQATESSDSQTELAGLRAEVTRLRAVQADQAELERLRQWQAQTEPELLRLRGMAGVARRANLEAEQLRAQLARQATETGTNPVTGAMAAAMKQALEQQVEGRLSRMTASLHFTPEQREAAQEILMRQARAMGAGMQQAMSGKYDKDELTRLGKEGGNTEAQIKALLTPDQQAAYPAYQHEEATYNASRAANTELLQMQSTLDLTPEQQDRVYAALYEVSFNQLTGVTNPSPGDVGGAAEALQWAMDQKARALEPVLTPAQLDKYRQQLALQAKVVKDVMSKLEGSSGSK